MKRLMFAAFVVGALVAGAGAANAATGQSAPAAGLSSFTLVDGGCGGPQFFRDRYGYCRPKGPPPPRYYGCRPGFHPTPYGCRPNY